MLFIGVYFKTCLSDGYKPCMTSRPFVSARKTKMFYCLERKPSFLQQSRFILRCVFERPATNPTCTHKDPEEPDGLTHTCVNGLY